jgi:hypothetical protein
MLMIEDWVYWAIEELAQLSLVQWNIQATFGAQNGEFCGG